MTRPILVEPVARRFRATTGEPLALSADGDSPVAAISALRAKIGAPLGAGAKRLASYLQAEWDTLDCVRIHQAQETRSRWRCSFFEALRLQAHAQTV